MTKGLCIITGASSGLGRTYAEQFAKDRYDLLVIARRLDKLEELKRNLHNSSVETYKADLSKEEEVTKLCKKIRNLAQISVLVNNAGFGQVKHLEDSDEALLLDMCSVNMLAPMRLALAALPVMKRLGSGKIINVSSLMSYQPSPGMALYGATKAFLTSFSTALAVEVEQHGIEVFTQCPGPVRTEFHLSAGLKQKIDALSAAEPEEVSKHLFSKISRSKRGIIVPGAVNNFLLVLSKIIPNFYSTKIVHTVLSRYIG